MSAAFRFPRFFMTNASPCPYLPGRTERKVFTELTGQHAGELNDALGRIGFRRSQNVAYRPSCADCSACVSVRIVTGGFKPGGTQRRLLRRNEDLVVNACRAQATDEQFELLQRYLSARHPGGGMTEMDQFDYSDMVEQSPVDTYVIEYRLPADRAGGQGRLVGACLTDRQGDGLSMIYSFYDPAIEDRQGLGSFIILDHIMRARNAGLPYVYLGYWVEGSQRMAYKVRYRPLERLGRDGWVAFDPEGGSTGSGGEKGAGGSAVPPPGLSLGGFLLK